MCRSIFDIFLIYIYAFIVVVIFMTRLQDMLLSEHLANSVTNNVSETCFLKVYIKIATRVRFLELRDLYVYGTTLSKGFTTLVIPYFGVVIFSPLWLRRFYFGQFIFSTRCKK